MDIFTFEFEDAKGGRTVVPVNCKPVTNVGSVAPGNDLDDPNPNGYPDDPSASEIVFDWVKSVIAFFGTLKGAAILIGSIVIAVVATVPPSVPGLQVQALLRRYFQELGGV